MAKDPAMLWYWSDWHSGTSLLSRFLKGCYIDLLHAQFNNGHLSLEEIKTCLGSDFGTSWPSLQKKFIKDENGLYFNVRLDQEKIKRQQFSESRRNNRLNKKKEITYDVSYEKQVMYHMENENVNTNILGKGSAEGKTKIPIPGEEIIFTIEHCLVVAMNDERWVKANKTNKAELEGFNQLLERRGEYERNAKDYKEHFANWKQNGKKEIPVTQVLSGPTAADLRTLKILQEVQ